MQVRGPSSLVPGVPNVKTFYAGSLSCPGENLVRSSGFEPPRYCYRQPLKLVRLPVPPRPHRSENFIVNAPPQSGKAPMECDGMRREPGSRFYGESPSAKARLQWPPRAYGFAGVDGAGLVAAGAGFENFCKIEPPCSTLRSTRTAIAIAHAMNITAHQVVAW